MRKLAGRPGLNTSFLIGILVGLSPLGCASVVFPYHFYNAEPDSYDGKILGPTAADDLPFSVCAPDAASNGNCIVMISDAFFQMKEDYLSTKQQLIDCQKGKK